MKNCKRFLSVIMILTIVLTITACGQKPNKDTSSTPQTSVSDNEWDSEVDLEDSASSNTSGTKNNSGPAETKKPTGDTNLKVGGLSWAEVLSKMPKSLVGTTIEIYSWNPANEVTGAPKAISDFEKATGIKVKWTTENFEDYLSKLASRVAADNAPDAVRLRTPLPAALISLQPLSGTGYDFSDKAWDQWVMDSYKVNGKVYGANLNNTHITAPDLLLYNKSLISKYDLPDPYTLWKQGKWTYKKFIEINKLFASDTNATATWSMWDAGQYAAWYGINGVTKFDGTKYTSLLKNEKFIKVTQDWANLMNKDKLLTGWDTAGFEQGKLLFWSASAIFARRTNTYFSEMKTSGILGVVPNPKIEGQDYYQLITENEAYGIAKGAKNAKAVPYFLRYFLDSENYDMNAFFCSKEALDVYKFCMSQTNKLWSTQYDEHKQFLGTNDSFYGNLKGVTGAQVPSVLNQNASIIDARVKRYNEQLAVIK